MKKFQNNYFMNSATQVVLSISAIKVENEKTMDLMNKLLTKALQEVNK